ncbi:fimbrial assembly protein [Pantoea rodasii]|uniref:Fimbrial assembly protein n=2 Tax=Pantoea rodasii TaxID=1076549 RepID=A0A2M9WD38_9GAMM|nr:fimbrial assembly protein [Pantoea rodasii]PJZ05455.1 fimbrial assembly protein [Pantoea rodasii]
MLAVNLLPWRMQRRQRRRQQSFTLLGCTLLLTGFMVLALWWRGSGVLRQQQQALAEISQQHDALRQQLALQQSLLQQRDGLLQAQLIRQQQKDEHQRWQHFWQQLPTLLPDTLWLHRVERRQGILLLEGQAQSMLAVQHFRQQLLMQPLFARVKPGSVQRQGDGHYRFTLRARVRENVGE